MVVFLISSQLLGTTNERIELSDDTLDVFSLIGKRLTRFTGFMLVTGELSKKVFGHLLGLCTSTESWLEVTDDGGSRIPA